MKTEKHLAGDRRRQARFKTKNPEKVADRRLRTRYGITLEERDYLFETQGRACACCRSESPGPRGVWQVDHDHVTKEIRGIVCCYCNIAIGAIHDSVVIAQRAIDYLTHGAERVRTARSLRVGD